jgi:hypothetical protein
MKEMNGGEFRNVGVWKVIGYQVNGCLQNFITILISITYCLRMGFIEVWDYLGYAI